MIGIKQKLSKIITEHRLIDLSREAAELAENERTLEVDHQSAARSSELGIKCITSSRKISRYQQDVAELTEKLEEQKWLWKPQTEQLKKAKQNLSKLNLKLTRYAQLADYQQALDAQQTRALQYQQAIAALEKAKTLCGLAI